MLRATFSFCTGIPQTKSVTDDDDFKKKSYVKRGPDQKTFRYLFEKF